MKILLVGEYSNVHWTLAEGLRAIGHDVTVISDGDRWKGYRRDISLVRHGLSTWGGIRYLARLISLLPKMRGYDIVQLINPVFLDLKAERIMPFYRYLRRNNGKMVMGAFGVDLYWVKAGMDCKTFRYSDFNIGAQPRSNADTTAMRAEWLQGAKGHLNQTIARDCDAIVSGLYENDASYRPHFTDKLHYIPFPIDIGLVTPKVRKTTEGIVKFFIGIQRARSAYKGTDIMLRALRRVEADSPGRCEVMVAESVPFAKYVEMLNEGHVLLDQLYSYTPAMNALQAMAQGMVVVGGGEPENYDILGEKELRPIVNVQPNEESVYKELANLVEHPSLIETLSRQSIEYISRYHSHVKVAEKYIDLYTQL